MDNTVSGQSLGDQMLGLLNMQYTGATNHSSNSNLGALGGSIAGQSPFSASPSSTVIGNITASEQTQQQQRVGITVPHHMLTSCGWPMVHQLTTQQQQATDSSATVSPAQQSLRNELALQQLAGVPAQQAAPGELNNYSLILQYWEQLQQQQHQMQLMHAGQLNQSVIAMPAVAQQEMEQRMPHLQVPLSCVPSSSFPYPAQSSAHAGAFFQSRPGITLAQAQIQAQMLAQVQAQAFAQVQARALTPASTLLSATPAGQEQQQPPLHGATHSDTSAANWDAANVGGANPAFANIYDFTPNSTLGSSGLFAGSTPRASPAPGSAAQKYPKPLVPKKTRRRTGLNNVRKDSAVAAPTPTPTPTKQGRSRSQSGVKSITTPGSAVSMLSLAEVPLAERFQVQTPPAEQMPSPPLQHHIPRRDVLGSAIDRLLAFHSSFTGMPRTLEEWNAVIDEHFVADGGLRLDLGTQSYDVPKSTAGRFYHTFFGADGVISMYVALGPATINALPIGTEFVVAFHNVLITTTYAGGRRVLESGALRAVFASDFRIRLWAFSATDATVCLPRKRPSGHDDALVRMADATIARNLEWSAEAPVAPPAQKRRKSSNGRQPQEECVLPTDSLRHAEVANIAFSLSDLLALQGVHDVFKVPELLDIWASLQSPSPAEVPKTDEPAPVSVPAPPRKRGRKRSTTTSTAPTAV
ncbi:hypothetical protein BX661DRAFT_181718 [Kickxella alabastrina]|uniref:uncharacterized protein n=1 Tax=Kickxella alabastrina TaxID=61397 RepID=UPI0022207000|nr:uncharacterized protein BX661DRAFT_181718 [Kickxella alabastrina]KAI7829285.1 hypothetical protein BX661DRAFT_181718 [Kickxella alabastrina]